MTHIHTVGNCKHTVPLLEHVVPLAASQVRTELSTLGCTASELYHDSRLYVRHGCRKYNSLIPPQREA
eukprot:10115892-Ditylum_brightwellii.AAC.1